MYYHSKIVYMTLNKKKNCITCTHCYAGFCTLRRIKKKLTDMHCCNYWKEVEKSVSRIKRESS